MASGRLDSALLRLCAGAVIWCGTALAAPAPDASPPSDSAPIRQTHLSFAQLGAGRIELQGLRADRTITVGTRGDEVVAAAKLRLRITYSPALLPDLSHLRVSINGQTVAALLLPKEQAGREIEREVVFDPRYFSDYTQISFDLVGHYALECEDRQHSSIWATISDQSALELELRPLELSNDLAGLPAPFFDRRDNRRLTLPIVLPAQSPLGVIRSAGVVASWFGMLADYRSARFPVALGDLPHQHALVFATNAAQPAQLTLPKVQQPTLSMVDHPLDRAIKLLVFQGKDEKQLQQAVEGFVAGNPVLSGPVAVIADVSIQPRAAYDVPRWLRTDRAVKLGELMDGPGQLQSSGFAPEPIRINLRLPPDLFTWNRAGVPVDLRYRYTSPVERDNSMLSISINHQLLRSYHLKPESDDIGGKLLVPFIQKESPQRDDEFSIPAFQLASNNEMQFQFSLEQHRKGLCTAIFQDASRQSIDPDSSIDISGFSHYTALPNLALFANAGFPFTRYADLAETAIVLPEGRAREALEQLFFILGRMGRQTGAAAVSYRLLDIGEARRAGNVDLLLLSGSGANALLQEWGPESLLQLDPQSRRWRASASAPIYPAQRTGVDARANTPDVRVTVQASGSLGAFLSFESPLQGSRTVIALVGTDAASAGSLIDTLEDESKVPLIRGELAVVRAGQVHSFQSASVYYVGELPWWRWLWFHVSLHPVLLTITFLVLGIVIALLIYGWLQRRVARRLQTHN